MITGFNTDVTHDGRIYHVQTEDRGAEHPYLESLVYVGGTIIAKKQTSYKDELGKGVTEDMIASRLKRQHQVIIAAIKAGRIEDLIRLSTKDLDSDKRASEQPVVATPAIPETVKRNSKIPVGDLPNVPVVEIQPNVPPSVRARTSGSLTVAGSTVKSSKSGPLNGDAVRKGKSGLLNGDAIKKGRSGPLTNPVKTGKSGPLINPSKPAKSGPLSDPLNIPRTGGLNDSVRVAKSGSLNLDEVISDYLKRSSQQEKLELKVITPNVFIAGKDLTLRIQVMQSTKPDTEAVVTVKIIGTAFKPQVYIGRTSGDGVASFNLHLPAFSAGTAAIVIEAQSNRGRGELKQLIRRA